MGGGHDEEKGNGGRKIKLDRTERKSFKKEKNDKGQGI